MPAEPVYYHGSAEATIFVSPALTGALPDRSVLCWSGVFAENFELQCNTAPHCAHICPGGDDRIRFRRGRCVKKGSPEAAMCC